MENKLEHERSKVYKEHISYIKNYLKIEKEYREGLIPLEEKRLRQKNLIFNLFDPYTVKDKSETTSLKSVSWVAPVLVVLFLLTFPFAIGFTIDMLLLNVIILLVKKVKRSRRSKAPGAVLYLKITRASRKSTELSRQIFRRYNNREQRIPKLLKDGTLLSTLSALATFGKLLLEKLDFLYTEIIPATLSDITNAISASGDENNANKNLERVHEALDRNIVNFNGIILRHLTSISGKSYNNYKDLQSNLSTFYKDFFQTTVQRKIRSAIRNIDDYELLYFKGKVKKPLDKLVDNIEKFIEKDMKATAMNEIKMSKKLIQVMNEKGFKKISYLDKISKQVNTFKGQTLASLDFFNKSLYVCENILIQLTEAIAPDTFI